MAVHDPTNRLTVAYAMLDTYLEDPIVGVIEIEQLDAHPEEEELGTSVWEPLVADRAHGTKATRAPVACTEIVADTERLSQELVCRYRWLMRLIG